MCVGEAAMDSGWWCVWELGRGRAWGGNDVLGEVKSALRARLASNSALAIGPMASERARLCRVNCTARGGAASIKADGELKQKGRLQALCRCCDQPAIVCSNSGVKRARSHVGPFALPHHHNDRPKHLHPSLTGERTPIGGTRTSNMQPTVGQRALSTLAKKLHPQLPLTPRESQQLLNLLTTSFRTHLDREHPVYANEKTHKCVARPNAGHNDQSNPRHATSSAALASRHIETVLSNPLFAVKPSRRGSESAASRVLNDPVTWFVNEIATGNAALSKAALVLDILDRQPAAQSVSHVHKDKTAGAVIGDWLHSSGLYNSNEFLDMCLVKPNTKRPQTFISRLVSVMMVDGKETLLWKWFSNRFSHEHSSTQAISFRKQLLKHMVVAAVGQDLHRSLELFNKAYQMVDEQSDKRWEELRPAGQYLVQAIMSKSTTLVDIDLYDSFRRNVRCWVPKKWAQAVNSMLCLHHPDKASARPGLNFIEDPAGAATYVKGKPVQRRFIVQLSLGIARQLLEQERYDEAQSVMAFTKQHFPDLVLDSLSAEQKRAATRQAGRIRKAQTDEEKNLELLDGLAFT
jgi:hypothetical protein